MELISLISLIPVFVVVIYTAYLLDRLEECIKKIGTMEIIQHTINMEIPAIMPVTKKLPVKKAPTKQITKSGVRSKKVAITSK